MNFTNLKTMKSISDVPISDTNLHSYKEIHLNR